MYRKPTGYNTLAFVNGLNGRSYKVNNGFANGQSGPGAPSSLILTYTFLAVPDDGTQWEIPEGPGNNPGALITPLQYDYAGAPGTGIIPLVAGGGTVAQCVTATMNVMNAQLDQWIASSPSASVLVLTYKNAGINIDSALVADMAADLLNTGLEGPATSLSSVLAGPTAVLPGRFGKNYCFLAI